MHKERRTLKMNLCRGIYCLPKHCTVFVSVSFGLFVHGSVCTYEWNSDSVCRPIWSCHFDWTPAYAVRLEPGLCLQSLGFINRYRRGESWQKTHTLIVLHPDNTNHVFYPLTKSSCYLSITVIVTREQVKCQRCSIIMHGLHNIR